MKSTRFLILMAAAPLLTHCGGPPPQGLGGPPPPTPVTVATVATESIVEWKEFTATVEATETVELRPRVSGYIEEVHFAAGELVVKGQLLFTIDQRAFETDRQRAAAELKRAEAVLAGAKKEFDRVEKLLAARAIAPESADARETAFLQAEAQHAAATAALRSAEIEFSHTEVRSPIAGRVGRALVTEGNYVSGLAGGASLLTVIVTIDPVYIHVPIDENSLLSLQALRKENSLLQDDQGRIPAKMRIGDTQEAEHVGFVESFDNR
ncbi:MAG: efflux RND transporter periplasmic adaptor subunit, partial [Verrucomicrobiota bacterium]